MTETEVRLPIYGSRTLEAVPAEPLGGNRYRVLHAPGLVEGLAAGDEFEVDPTAPLGFTVLRRSGNLTVWFFMDQRDRAALEGHPIRKDVEALGGWLDGGSAKLLVFTVPLRAGFAAIAAVMDSWTARVPGSSWMFGNVYDPADGHTPLNWWVPPTGPIDA